MRLKKGIVSFFVAVVLAVGVFGGWLIGRNSHTATSSGSALSVASWLFSHTADEGEIRSASDGSLELVLRKFDAHVTAFTDRPYRDARIETVEWLVDSWVELFADDPPNAVLVEHDADGAAQSVVVTLFSPVLADGELRFTVTVIDAEDGSDVAEIAGVQHENPVRQFQEVSLFIDDVSLSCAQGGTCVIGDVGPGGGIVFYAPKRPFTSEVSNCASTCRYLEAARTDIGGMMQWDVAMATAIDFVSNGLDDWSVPTQDELNELYLQRGKVGGFAKDSYWASHWTSAGIAFIQYFAGGQRAADNQTSFHLMRPIRAFS